MSESELNQGSEPRKEVAHYDRGGPEDHCSECGMKGDVKQGYGGVHALKCPNCGNEWTV